MVKKIFTLLLILSQYLPARCQNIGIGTLTPDPSAALDITGAGKGLLIPRMSSAAITAIPDPAKGLMVYDSVKNRLVVNMGSPKTPDWQDIVSGSGWALTGNSGINRASNFMGTTDSVPLLFRINNQWAGIIDSTTGNTHLGYGAGRSGTRGTLNTAFGYQALDSNTIGNNNTAFGAQALNTSVNPADQTLPDNNTAIGYQAIYQCRHNNYNFNPQNNTAVGYQAAFNGGRTATVVGYQALFRGGDGIAIGVQALYSPIAISYGATGIANGVRALYYNTEYSGDLSYGAGNVATGSGALFNCAQGNDNTANGYQALYKNYYGNYNVGLGVYALYTNINHASQNTAVGAYSLLTTTQSDGNTALGYNAGHNYDNGYYNCFIGSETDADGPDYYNTIALGHGTLVTAPNMMRVGNGATTSIGGPVGWSVVSDGRVKKNIRENVPGLAFIKKLRPISYTIDVAAMDRIQQARTLRLPPDAIKTKESIIYTGFIAQEVEQAAQSLNYDFSGVDAARNNKDLYSLRYADFVAPLVKAVQELAARNGRLKKTNDELVRQKEQVLQALDELEIKIK